ncbi:MAG: CTB family bacteriocin [Cyanobacteria bacterium P01_A01_bin.84]
MSEEMKNTAIELSADELDEVNGGFGIILAPGQEADSFANSNFNQSVLQVGQSTVAGPGGAGTSLVVNAADINSNANNAFNVFNS